MSLSGRQARAVLDALLARLPVSITEGASVTVLDSWVEGEGALCLVYRSPDYNGVLGFRATTSLPPNGEPSSAAALGQDLADFAVGEPLGNVVSKLRQDAHGVNWWGELQADLPHRPS